MKRYLNILVLHYKAWIMRDMEYRASFISMLAANFAWTNFTLISILLINKNIPNFGGWNVNDLMVLTGCWMLINFLMFTFVYGNIRRLTRDIFNGNLDFFLLRPIDTQFFVTAQRCHISSSVSLVEGIALLIYSFTQGGYPYSLTNFIGFIILLAGGALLYYSFWMITACVNIFTPLADNLLYIIPEINYISKYPTEAFPKTISAIFTTIVPVMLITTLPAKMLIGKLDSVSFIVGIFISMVFFVGTRRLWLWSLKHYTSASS